MSLLDQAQIAKIMSTEGPVVSVVFLRQGGTMEAMEIDMSPSKNVLAQMLQGPLTFIGEFLGLNTVAMKRLQKDKTHKLNKQIFLPHT